MYFLFLGLISWFLIVVLSGNYSVVVVCKRDFARSRSAKCWTAWTEETWQYIQTKVAQHVHIYTCHVYTQKPKKIGQHDMITQTNKQTKKQNKQTRVVSEPNVTTFLEPIESRCLFIPNPCRSVSLLLWTLPRHHILYTFYKGWSSFTAPQLSLNLYLIWFYV